MLSECRGLARGSEARAYRGCGVVFDWRLLTRSTRVRLGVWPCGLRNGILLFIFIPHLHLWSLLEKKLNSTWVQQKPQQHW